jgi:glycosyltransferase
MKVSVITSSFNSQDTIVDTLESIQSQLYKNIEHIIVDGASTDKTIELARSYEGKEVQVRVYSEPDSGIYDAWNKGIGHVTGDIVTFLNSDDYYPNNEVLNDVIRIFEENSEVDFVVGDIDMINNEGVVKREWRVSPLTDGELTEQLPQPALFYRAKVFKQECSKFDPKYRICADLKHQLTMINKYKHKGVVVSKVLTKMLLGGASTAGIRAYLQSWKESVLIYNEVMGRGGLVFTIKKVWKKILQRT